MEIKTLGLDIITEESPVFDSTLKVRKVQAPPTTKGPSLFSRISPFLAISGNELVNFDEDSEGGDDFAGQLLLYVSEAGSLIEQGEELPELPEILQKGTKERISGKARLVLRISSSFLTLISYTQFPAGSKEFKAFKYIGDAVRLLIANKDVPAFKL